MNPLHPAIIARWQSMWAKDCCPERPWWTRHEMTYRRCDGITILSRVSLDLTHGDERGLWDGKEPYADAMARIDSAHPLPAPGPMPGQVWTFDGQERSIIAVRPGDDAIVTWYGPPAKCKSWPPPGAILVAGPTPWGRDCPWSPA